MNAQALLSAQGWRGKGHSLHRTDDSIGLANPLLLSRKDNTKGLGIQKHFTSDQWWMDAFDEQLKGLDTSKEGKVLQTVTSGKIEAVENFTAGKYQLYASFVKGGLLQGTIQVPEESRPSTPPESINQISREADRSAKRALKIARRERKEAKRKRKVEQSAENPDGQPLATTEQHQRAGKQEKRRRKKDKE